MNDEKDTAKESPEDQEDILENDDQQALDLGGKNPLEEEEQIPEIIKGDD